MTDDMMTGIPSPQSEPTSDVAGAVRQAGPSALLDLPYVSPVSPLYLPCISPMSPLYLPYISRPPGGAQGALLPLPAAG